MKFWRYTFPCLVASLLLTHPVSALNIMNIPVLRGTPLIDGRITPEEMKYAGMTSMTLVGSIDRPKHATTVVMLVGQNAFYAGFICEDSETTQIRSRVQKENGPVFQDDSVEVVLTPAKDVSRSNYFHFAVNAAGVRYSNNMANDTPVPNWQAAAQRTANGWQVEMLIPLESINATMDVPYWRANASRNRPARGTENAEVSAWVDPGSTLHNFRRFGYLKLVQMPFPQLVDVFGADATMEKRPGLPVSSSLSTSAPR